MRNKTHLLVCAALLLAAAACKKVSSINDPGASTTNTSGRLQTDSGFPVITTNIFGALTGYATGTPSPADQKVIMFDSLKCKYARMGMQLHAYSGANLPQYDALSGTLKILLNANWDNGSDVYATDTVAFKTKLNVLLTKYHPEVLVVENEETNPNYFNSGTSIYQYFNELKAAITQVHAFNLANGTSIKVSNGGITERAMTLITWKAYTDSGKINLARSYAARAFPASYLNSSGDPNIAGNARLKRLLDTGTIMINMYRTLNMDLVNMHWYEPVAQREIADPGLQSLTSIDTQTFGETVRCLRNKTCVGASNPNPNKNVMTNEIGTLNPSGNIVTQLMQKAKDMSLPYCIWYSVYNADPNQAHSLQNNSPISLTTNGKAFKTFITGNY